MRAGDILIRKFVRNSEKTEDPRVREAYGTLAGTTDILCNIFLFAVKFIVGLVIASTAVTADAFDNLSDAFSAIVSLISVRVAARPADKEHPFGHGRVEYASSLIVAIVIIVVGVEFFKTSVERIFNPAPLSVSAVAVIFLVLSILVKLWMYFFNKSVGERVNSSLFSVTASDAIFDMMTTSVTLVSVIVYVIFGKNIDGICGLIVSCVVIYAGIDIAKDTMSPLIGEPMSPEFQKRIEDIVSSIPGVVGVHDLVVHNYGPSHYMATIHAEVSRRMTLDEAHAIADKAERKVQKEMDVLLVVHIDPVEIHDQRVKEIRQKLTDILKETDPQLSFHDLQVRHSRENRNGIDVIFDLAVPYSYTKEDENKTVRLVADRMRCENKNCKCIVTIDRGYVPDVEE